MGGSVGTDVRTAQGQSCRRPKKNARATTTLAIGRSSGFGCSVRFGLPIDRPRGTVATVAHEEPDTNPYGGASAVE